MFDFPKSRGLQPRRVPLAEDTIRLSQATMAELFQISPRNITLHLKALHAEGEISPGGNLQEFREPAFHTLPRADPAGAWGRPTHGASWVHRHAFEPCCQEHLDRTAACTAHGPSR